MSNLFKRIVDTFSKQDGSDPSKKPVESSEHESICNLCAKCCYKKIIVDGDVLTTPFPCNFLNEETKKCTVYENRYEKNPHCLSVEKGMKVRAFPEDCTYVPTHAPKGYEPARTDWDWSGWWHRFDELADTLDVSPEVRAIVRARGPFAPLPWTLLPKPESNENENSEKENVGK